MSSEQSSASHPTTPVCDKASHAHFRECPKVLEMIENNKQTVEYNNNNYQMAQNRFLAVDEILDRLRKSIANIQNAKLRVEITDEILLMKDHARLGAELFSSKEDKRIAASERTSVYRVAAKRYKQSLEVDSETEEAAINAEVSEHDSTAESEYELAGVSQKLSEDGSSTGSEYEKSEEVLESRPTKRSKATAQRPTSKRAPGSIESKTPEPSVVPKKASKDATDSEPSSKAHVGKTVSSRKGVSARPAGVDTQRANNNRSKRGSTPTQRRISETGRVQKTLPASKKAPNKPTEAARPSNGYTNDPTTTTIARTAKGPKPSEMTEEPQPQGNADVAAPEVEDDSRPALMRVYNPKPKVRNKVMSKTPTTNKATAPKNAARRGEAASNPVVEVGSDESESEHETRRQTKRSKKPRTAGQPGVAVFRSKTPMIDIDDDSDDAGTSNKKVSKKTTQAKGKSQARHLETIAEESDDDVVVEKSRSTKSPKDAHSKNTGGGSAAGDRARKAVSEESNKRKRGLDDDSPPLKRLTTETRAFVRPKTRRLAPHGSPNGTLGADSLFTAAHIPPLTSEPDPSRLNLGAWGGVYDTDEL